MLLLTGEHVRTALPMPRAIEAAADGYRTLAANACVIPERLQLPINERIETMLVMPGYLRQPDRTAGVKLASICRNNPARGLPIVTATMLLIDPDTGLPSAVMDGAALTAIRTGASGGLAARYLAPANAECAAVIGAGVQARTLLSAVACVRTLSRVLVYDPCPGRAEVFAREMGASFGISVQPAGTAREAVAGADAVLCATTATTPVVSLDDVTPPVFIASIGSYRPDMQELGPDLLTAAEQLIVDTREGVLSEAGDFIIPIDRGIMTADVITGTMSDLVTGRASPPSGTGITIYKAVGHAVLDLATASAAATEAYQRGIGREVEL